MEIDWSVGQIHKAIKESGIERKTMIISCVNDFEEAGRVGQEKKRKERACSFHAGTLLKRWEDVGKEKKQKKEHVHFMQVCFCRGGTLWAKEKREKKEHVPFMQERF